MERLGKEGGFNSAWCKGESAAISSRVSTQSDENPGHINKTLFFGLARERQWGVEPTSPFYEEWMAGYYADYNPNKSNELLDQMGLKRGTDGIRIKQNGEPLYLNASESENSELIKTTPIILWTKENKNNSKWVFSRIPNSINKYNIKVAGADLDLNASLSEE